jgi:dTMP kinase
MSHQVIIFEGLDGAGKSSIIDDLMLYLPSPYTVTCSAEPYNLPLFALSSDPVTATLQLVQARWEHCNKLVKESAHWSGNHIHLIDRFDLSTVAYQGYGDGVDLSFIDNLNRHVTRPLTDIVEPLYLYLDIPVDLVGQRVQERGEVLSDTQADRLERVRRGYLKACEEGHGVSRIYPTVINATRAFGEVYREVLECVTGGDFGTR